jgi:PKD repeat protein
LAILIAMLVLLLLLCVLLILRSCLPTPPGPGELTADAGGPYMVGEGQPLTLDGSGSVGDTISNYAWDFGDGTTGSGVAPSHTYADGPAQYTVSLTVTDDEGQTASDTAQVTVNNLPPTAEAGGPYTCVVGESITLSGVCDDPGPTDAASLSCTWADFSGAAVSEPSYTCPSTPGTVTLTLTATDKDGASAQDTASVTVVTEVLLSADADGPYTGTVGIPVTVDGSGSTPADAIISYSWNFGDGQTGSGAVISHTYAATGTYSVSLTVSDGTFQDTDTTTATISAAAPNPAPTAVIQVFLISKDGQLSLLNSGSSDPTARSSRMVGLAHAGGRPGSRAHYTARALSDRHRRGALLAALPNL